MSQASPNLLTLLLNWSNASSTAEKFTWRNEVTAYCQTVPLDFVEHEIRLLTDLHLVNLLLGAGVKGVVRDMAWGQREMLLGMLPIQGAPLSSQPNADLSRQ